MNNKDFIERIVRCEDCCLRYSEDCPMHYTIFTSHKDSYIIDSTEDNWFCSEGRWQR